LEPGVVSPTQPITTTPGLAAAEDVAAVEAAVGAVSADPEAFAVSEASGDTAADDAVIGVTGLRVQPDALNPTNKRAARAVAVPSWRARRLKFT
jgi:hypothetical protein